MSFYVRKSPLNQFVRDAVVSRKWRKRRETAGMSRYLTFVSLVLTGDRVRKPLRNFLQLFSVCQSIVRVQQPEKCVNRPANIIKLLICLSIVRVQEQEKSTIHVI